MICCICLCHTHEFVARAVRCYRSQDYLNKQLTIWDSSGGKPFAYSMDLPVNERCVEELPNFTVGELRNRAISWALSLDAGIDFIAHFDHDDWSAPDRLSIQLAHIQKCGKLAVGFRDLLMYETKTDKVYFYQNPHPHYTLGTSLFYKREAWEKMKFPDKTPEDPQWRRQLGFDNFEGMSSLRADGTPIMIQVIHGANASARIIRGGTYFKEASESQAKAVREILANA